MHEKKLKTNFKMNRSKNRKKSGFQFLVILLICYLTSPVHASVLSVDVTIGEEVTVECKSAIATSLFWVAQDGTVITSKPCKTCNIKSEAFEEDNGDTISLLKMVPFMEKDFGNYSCHGDMQGVKVLNTVSVAEKKTQKELLKCRKELVQAQFLSEGRLNPPLCEKDGKYKPVQVRKDGETKQYRCVDQKTGEQQGIETTDIYALECTATKISIPVSIGILVGVQAIIIIFDLILYFSCKEGIIAHFLKKRRRKNYRALRTDEPKRQRVASIAPKHHITSIDHSDDETTI